jgi:hypothetical protein
MTTHQNHQGVPARLVVALQRAHTAGAIPFPVEVRTRFLVPVARGWTDEPIELAAGTYVVSVELPGAAPAMGEVQVAAGEDLRVVLGSHGAELFPAATIPDDEASAPIALADAPEFPPRAAPIAAGGAAPLAPGPPSGLESALPALQPLQLRSPRVHKAAAALGAQAREFERKRLISVMRPRAAPPAAPIPGVTIFAFNAGPGWTQDETGGRSVTLQLLTGNPLAGPMRGAGAPAMHVRFGGPADAPQTGFDSGGERAFAKRAEGADRLVVQVGDAGLPEQVFALVRIAEQEEAVRFVAVPIGWKEPVRIEIERQAGRRELLVETHAGDAVADALLHYRSAGQLDQARSLLDRYREEIFNPPTETSSPLRWAVIALLTLRLTDPRDWQSLAFYARLVDAAKALPSFPDLQAIAADAAARMGQAELARTFALRATAQGLPYLSDSLSLLHARVLELARPPRPDQEMRNLYQQLAPLLNLVDLKAVLLTLRGGDEQIYQP